MAPKLGIQDLVGHRLRDNEGHNVGRIGRVYRDDQTHQPTWVTVHTGMFGMQESFVPVEGAQIADEELTVPFAKDLIKDSPRFGTERHLSPEEEGQLYRHYGVQPSVPGPRGEAAAGTGETAPGRRDAAGGEMMGETLGGDAERGTAAREDGADRGETFVTRSEEQAHIGVERRESGRVRVHKSVESERFDQDVPVRHEEIRVHREPVTEQDRAMGGSMMGEQDEEIVLHEEHAVLGTEEVPMEKLRVSKEEVTDTEHVSGELRKERIDVEEFDEDGRPRRPRE